MLRTWLSLCFALAFSLTAVADPLSLAVQEGKSSLTYHLVHKLHRFDGTSKNVTGRAVILADGRAQVEVRAAVESFDSGNANRDEHMKETVEAARYPTITVKALVDAAQPPAQFPSTIKKTAKAQFEFHGVKQTLDLPVSITWTSAKTVEVDASFPLSLDAFQIKRPSLMFVAIDDQMVVDGKIAFAVK